MKHPFARTFDLLSHEYGWTDDQILDLTLPRMRQAREMCVTRLNERRNWEIDLAEQVTRVLVGHIRSAGGDKRAAATAAKVRLFKRGKQVPTIDQVARKLGGSPGMNVVDPELVKRAYGPR